jgi:DNA-binding PadR family transcriptional regulator
VEVRRKSGSLTPLEAALLLAGLELLARGEPEFFGFQIAKRLEDADDSYRWTGYGSLYRALDRLEGRGLLESRLEPAELAEVERRPRRRLYRLTSKGATAHDDAARVPVSERFVVRLESDDWK